MTARRPMLRGLRGLFAMPALAVGMAAAATIEQPRTHGHVIGDVLIQRVLLQHEGRDVAPTALPPADRVGPWFERRPVRTETDDEGRRWLAIDYQVINAPPALGTVWLPALTIATDAGVPLALPAWPVDIGPLTPPEALAQGVSRAMLPDRPVAMRATQPFERQLKHSIGALAIVLLAWLAWWVARQWRDAHRLPFAMARRVLHRLDPDSAEAWQAVHRAIDASAGHAVHSVTLPRLLLEQPQLAPLRRRLEDFYRSSDQRFFTGQPDAPPFPLLDLCRALSDAEKRHHR